MINLNTYIIEKFKISKDIGQHYNYHPKDKDELTSLLERLLKERGPDADLNDIDVSKITDMSDLFGELYPYNIDISQWDVSNVENMDYMFYKCYNFNSDLSKWDVSSVIGMYSMFEGSKFNGDISSWDVSSVTDMRDMFKNCPLEKNPPKWYHE